MIIVLTGPESSAKSTLSRELARHFGGVSFPEFAREYLTAKGDMYEYGDVEEIARGQIRQFEKALEIAGKPVFLDTWLIITKVWFEWSFGQAPGWLLEAIDNHRVDLFLLCRPDIPWEPDPLREHGGDIERSKLFTAYKTELTTRGFPFAEIGGTGQQRLQNAIQAVETLLKPS